MASTLGDTAMQYVGVRCCVVSGRGSYFRLLRPNRELFLPQTLTGNELISISSVSLTCTTVPPATESLLVVDMHPQTKGAHCGALSNANRGVDKVSLQVH